MAITHNMKMKVIHTTVSEDLVKLKEKYNLNWSEALKVGMGILLLERGCENYFSPLNEFRVELMYKVLQQKNKSEQEVKNG